MSSGRYKLSQAKYRLLKIEVAERDGHRCVICGNTAISAHHVQNRSSGGGDFASNIVCLCITGENCHQKVDKYELEIPEHILESIGYYSTDQKRLKP